MALVTPQSQISSNIFKTWVIMFGFSLFVIAVVYIFARGFGYEAPNALSFTGIAFIMAGVMNFLSYFYSDKMVLAISKAKSISEQEDRELYQLVRNLSLKAAMPLPKIYIIDDTAPNAFATGRDPKHAVIAFTTGILDKLNKQELEGVIAHELSHVKNRDILLSSVVSILVGFIALLADWFLRMSFYGGRDNDRDNKNNGIFLALAIVAALLSPLIATLIQLALSRRRESLADASGVFLTRNPQGLADALGKISGDKEPLEVANRATAHLYIVNPLKGSEAVGWFSGLFNTHPPIEERIKALQAMQGQM